MKVLYIQDQEIIVCKGRFYHSKSKHYFQRYLAGLTSTDRFKVLCYNVKKNDENSIERYQDITDERIEFDSFPDFRSLSNYITINSKIKHTIKDMDFCYIRTGISGIIAAHFCRKYHIPYMFIVNEDLEANLKTNKRLIVKLGASLIGKLTRYYINNANYSCYVTKEYLQKRYPCSGIMLGCSDIENLTIDERSLIEYKNKKKNTLDLVIGTAGPVHTVLKGHDVVIRAMRLLKERGIHVQYQLVGSGDRKRLESIAENERVQDSIAFFGEKSREEVLEWMKDLDVYIQPSRSEGLPRSIIEAMTNALPCIASDVGGIPELIPNRYLFHHDDTAAEQVAKIISSISSEELNEMSETNFTKSKSYDPLLLDRTRYQFFSSAISSIRNRHSK